MKGCQFLSVLYITQSFNHVFQMSFSRMVKLHIFIFHNLHQILAHIVGLPPSPVIDLDVLKKNQSLIVGQLQLQSAKEDKIHLEEAEEESINGNGVDGEAGGGHDVGTDHDQQDRDEAGGEKE